MDDNALRELWIVAKEHERPPYWFADEGLGNRLSKAIRRVQDSQVTPHEDGSYTVAGSGERAYVVRGSTCACPNSQHGKSSWCYHRVAVALYVEWQKRLHPAGPPVRSQGPASPLAEEKAEAWDLAARIDAEDDTLGNGFPVDDATLPLPLPPVTVDERLAAPVPQEPLGAPMPADAYIPEPDTDHGTTAVLDAPEPTPVTRPLPGPVLLPSLDARTLEQSMQAYAAQRQVVTRYIKEQMTEGVDYYTLTIKGRVSKATLSKAGSEKFLSLFQLHAAFQQDQATWQMLGAKEGLLCYTCTLMTRSGEVIGEGRGARSVTQDGGDINKAIKMATKSAQVDAILRTGALSDVFTQDLDDPPEAVPVTTPPRPSSSDLRQRIWTLVHAADPTLTTRAQVQQYVTSHTGYALEPDLYPAILDALEGGRP